MVTLADAIHKDYADVCTSRMAPQAPRRHQADVAGNGRSLDERCRFTGPFGPRLLEDDQVALRPLVTPPQKTAWPPVCPPAAMLLPRALTEA